MGLLDRLKKSFSRSGNRATTAPTDVDRATVRQREADNKSIGRPSSAHHGKGQSPKAGSRSAKPDDTLEMTAEPFEAPESGSDGGERPSASPQPKPVKSKPVEADAKLETTGRPPRPPVSTDVSHSPPAAPAAKLGSSAVVRSGSESYDDVVRSAKKKRMQAVVEALGDHTVDKWLDKRWQMRVEALKDAMTMVQARASSSPSGGGGGGVSTDELLLASCKLAEKAMLDKIAPVFLAAVDLLRVILDALPPSDPGMARTTLGPVLPGLIQWCASTNSRVQESAIQTVMLLAQQSSIGPSGVTPYILQPPRNKRAVNVVQSRLLLLLALLPPFGVSEEAGLSLEKVMKVVGPALSSPDNKIRKMAVAVCVELYRYTGTELNAYTKHLSPQLLKTLDQKFAQVDRGTEGPSTAGAGGLKPGVRPVAGLDNDPLWMLRVQGKRTLAAGGAEGDMGAGGRTVLPSLGGSARSASPARTTLPAIGGHRSPNPVMPSSPTRSGAGNGRSDGSRSPRAGRNITASPARGGSRVRQRLETAQARAGSMDASEVPSLDDLDKTLASLDSAFAEVADPKPSAVTRGQSFSRSGRNLVAKADSSSPTSLSGLHPASTSHHAGGADTWGSESPNAAGQQWISDGGYDAAAGTPSTTMHATDEDLMDDILNDV